MVTQHSTNDSVLEVALKERDKLLKELEADPKFQRLKKLELFISTYRELELRSPRQQHQAVRRISSQSQQIEDITREILLQEQPLPTRIILDRLTQRGIKIEGLKPVSILSAVLSRSKEFEQAEGRLGWRIKPTKAREVPDKIDEVLGKNEASPGQTGEASTEE